jgi:hypothetical protein
MRGKGTPRRRVKVVRERPSTELLDRLDSLQIMLNSNVGQLRALIGEMAAYVDLVSRRIDGLEAKLAAEKMREAVKW